MRHGFTTLTKSQKCRANNGSTLAHPLWIYWRIHSAGKVMASIFLESQGTIMNNYLEQGRVINGAYYACELRQLRQKIARKRRGNLTPCVLLLHVTISVATECGFETLPHPLYSPDMAPTDFYMFPKLKSHLRGKQYGSYKGVIEAVNEYLWPGKDLLFWRDKGARTEMG